jgi:hypothetical protein
MISSEPVRRSEAVAWLMRAIVLATFLLGAMVAAAQEWPPATFLPAAPTSRDAIRAVFEIPGCIPIGVTSIVGTVIREDIMLSCTQGPPPITIRYFSGFGPLPANTYTYEIYFDYRRGDPPLLRSTQQLVVTEAVEIPTLSDTVLLMMGVALAYVALRASGRSA